MAICCSPTLCDDLVVIGVRADPDPMDVAFDLGCQRAVMQADAHGPKRADFLEVQRGMLRIRFQQLEVFIGKVAD